MSRQLLRSDPSRSTLAKSAGKSMPLHCFHVSIEAQNIPNYLYTERVTCIALIYLPSYYESDLWNYTNQITRYTAALPHQYHHHSPSYSYHVQSQNTRSHRCSYAVASHIRGLLDRPSWHHHRICFGRRWRMVALSTHALNQCRESRDSHVPPICLDGSTRVVMSGCPAYKYRTHEQKVDQS